MKIDFSFDTEYGKFVDSISLPDDHNLLNEEIESLKQQRLENWIAMVTYVPTEEELEQAQAEFDKLNLKD